MSALGHKPNQAKKSMDIFNFAFVKTIDSIALRNAIILINRSRHHPVTYTRLIQTKPQRGWIALIIDNVTPDHYLLRNLSGRLETKTFELGMNGISLYYRLHENGQTVSAFESHLALWITQQLRIILNTDNIMRIDLAEPAARLVLQRYHEHRRSRTWAQPSASHKIAPAIEQHYRGQVDKLKDIFEPGTQLAYVRDIVKPGFSAETALKRLVNVLALPYFKGEPVLVESDEQLTHSIDAQLATVETDANELALVLKGRRVVRDLAVLQPRTWAEDSDLPTGWTVITRDKWTDD